MGALVGTVPVYATRRRVKLALDVAETARADTQIDAALQSASRSVEGLCNRVFYPTRQTLTFDWPNPQNAASWRLWLDNHELASLDTLQSAGATITGALLRPDWGPPFTYIELNRATTGGFTSGASPQRSISVAGTYGFDANDVPAAGRIAFTINASVTAINVTDSSDIGPGSLLLVGTERMVCTGATMTDIGLTVANSLLTASNAAVTLTASGTGISVGEILLIDSERMLVVDGSGTTLTVKRAYDGSVLAAHSSGAAINALRLLTVERGVLGTTAAGHNAADQIYRKVYPAPVVNLTVALALSEMGLEQGAYKVVNTRGGHLQTKASVDMADLADRVYNSYGRKNRRRAV